MSDPESSPVLVAQGLSKRYGPTTVLRDVSMRLSPGRILALLGENGAGKSTFVKILSGAVVPTTGAVQVAGGQVKAGNPEAARSAGIAMVYQELSVCDDLSVEDNIMLGREVGRFGWLDRTRQRRIVRDALDRLGHADLDPTTKVSELSVGAKQLVEIARAIAADAKVLILDEPTSSLPRSDVKRLFDVTRKLAGEGLAVIYISHFLEEIRELCDSFFVLRDGRLAGSGELAGVTEADIVQLMVGRSVDELYPQTPRSPGDPVLKLTRISGRPIPCNVSLSVRRGEIFGIAGLVGAGRTELARCLAGLDGRTGTLAFRDEVIAAGDPAAAIHAGLAMVSEDRKGEGLAQNLSIMDNATISRLDPYQRLGFLNERRRTAATEAVMTRLQVKADGPTSPVSNLSGGNQQKVALARVLHQQANCLILDEPTRGVDVGTKSEIYRLIGRVAAEGTVVIFISSYFAELLHMCDRIAVMARGRVMDVRPADDWTEHDLLLSALGSDAKG